MGFKYVGQMVFCDFGISLLVYLGTSWDELGFK
jgi:hypothetical protein